MGPVASLSQIHSRKSPEHGLASPRLASPNGRCTSTPVHAILSIDARCIHMHMQACVHCLFFRSMHLGLLSSASWDRRASKTNKLSVRTAIYAAGSNLLYRLWQAIISPWLDGLDGCCGGSPRGAFLPVYRPSTASIVYCHLVTRSYSVQLEESFEN